MHDAAAVHVRQRARNLNQKPPNGELVKALAALAHSHQILRKVAALSELENEVEIIVLQEGLDVLDDVGLRAQHRESWIQKERDAISM